MMYSGLDDVTKQRMMQAKALSMEARGVGLNLGKKMSVPKDIMMEELNLSSNRGSRMFQERQKRAERFTLENAINGVDNTSNVRNWETMRTRSALFKVVLMPSRSASFPTGFRNSHIGLTGDCKLPLGALTEIVPPPQNFQPAQSGKENQVLIIPGKHHLVKGLQKSVAAKGRPEVLAPGYSGPLKEAPSEKFNTTVIPRSYCSPWTAALGGHEEVQNVLSAELLQNLPPPVSYRCFNRSAVPFGGATASKRAIPVISFEAVESQQLPGVALKRMCHRPNFNRAPRGWRVDYRLESNEL
ncbi:Myozenin-2 Calsarcin-1 [Takifugu flavidus]|uniref:Myozenin-2 Calsarcin-1 n=1 Tax=Takifugu flavidus TaxID=433684 RepID=A0A5C6MJL2_9TELE|nr:Myozenin-2 Calsarcin-1 [Takifugu flavidus]